MEDFEAIVIGGGHAGIEAASCLARRGFATLLVTQSLDAIGRMSCNPAIGGLAKGNLVREIDALGGLMARLIDRTMIQFRILNRSKGPAVQAPRAQADKARYAAEAKHALERTPNLAPVPGHGHRFPAGGRGDPRCAHRARAALPRPRRGAHHRHLHGGAPVHRGVFRPRRAAGGAAGHRAGDPPARAGLHRGAPEDRHPGPGPVLLDRRVRPGAAGGRRGGRALLLQRGALPAAFGSLLRSRIPPPRLTASSGRTSTAPRCTAGASREWARATAPRSRTR